MLISSPQEIIKELLTSQKPELLKKMVKTTRSLLKPDKTLDILHEQKIFYCGNLVELSQRELIALLPTHAQVREVEQAISDLFELEGSVPFNPICIPYWPSKSDAQHDEIIMGLIRALPSYKQPSAQPSRSFRPLAGALILWGGAKKFGSRSAARIFQP